MKEFFSSQNIPRVIVVLMALLLAGYMFFGANAVNNLMPEKSVEVGVSSLSPKGIAGGFAIPASCPSYEHSPGECAPPQPSFGGTSGGGGGGGGGGGAVTINNGGSVTLQWNASSAMSCDGLNFSTGGATSGSVVVTPPSTTSYTIVCNYNPGVYSPSTVQSSVGVTVLNPSIGITANPGSVRSGRQSTITWSATNVDSCSVTGPGGFSQNGVSGSALSNPITAQSTFILTCQNAGGTLSASAIVTLIPSFEEF